MCKREGNDQIRDETVTKYPIFTWNLLMARWMILRSMLSLTAHEWQKLASATVFPPGRYDTALWYEQQWVPQAGGAL